MKVYIKRSNIKSLSNIGRGTDLDEREKMMLRIIEV